MTKDSQTRIEDLPSVPITPSGKLLGHLSAFGADPLGVAMKALRQNERLVRLRVGAISVFFTFHPDDIRTVLTAESAYYSKNTRGYDKFRFLVGNGLVTSQGEDWRRQRRIIQPAFRKKCIEGFADTMVSFTRDWCEAKRGSNEDPGVLDMSAELNALTLRIAGKTLMNLDTSQMEQDVGAALEVLSECFNRMVANPLPWAEHWPTKANRQMWRAINTLHSLTDSLIEERRNSGQVETDLLGMLMAAEDPESQEKLDDLQLRDEVLTMLLAGHETTANGLMWTLYLLAQHPEITARLETEVDTILEGREVSVSDMKSLIYTNQVIKECLRLYPPAWTVVRRAEVDTELGGCRIPKGSYVFVSPYVMHRHPAYWEEPEAFNPHRFVPSADEVDRFVYFPFLRGQRQCIGDRFAQMEMTLLLVTFVQHYRFILAPDQRIEVEPSITLRSKHGMRMQLVPRSREL